MGNQTKQMENRSMEKKRYFRMVIEGLCAVCVFGLLFGLSFPLRGGDLRRITPEIVVFGDSIMGECREEDSIPAKLSEVLGRETLNSAFGGTRMSRMDQARRLDDNRDGLSMAALSKAVVTGDFGVQQTVHITEGGTDFFDEAVDVLERVDFEQVKLVFLEYGLNDYHNAVPLDNRNRPLDEYTFVGALRAVVKALRKAYPNLRIILVTPTYTWYPERGLTCENYDTGNGYLYQYVDAQLQAADELGVECIDLYHDLYSHESYEDWERYTRDGIHPNEEGRTLIARTITEYLTEKERNEEYENARTGSRTVEK
ncbi:MAG: SGNH/GDSL hydrolase family protein [Roseburia sp.]|nr:SGNH/GDSL hydrolase family protein [Roseburia sp.]